MHRTNWRDLEEWRAEKLPLASTSSNEAAKLYDMAITQFVGWFDDPAAGGLEKTVERMLQADPNFVHGKTLAFGLELMGTSRSIHKHPAFAAQLKELNHFAESRSDVSARELKHIEAVDHFAHGNFKRAAFAWEQILRDHPTDILALKLAQDTYFYHGAKLPMRDSIARVYPFWFAEGKKCSIPLSDYIHGLYAFGLEESRCYAQAEQQAMQGLEKMKDDAWAAHALAHVYEMDGRSKEGLRFLSSTVDQWSRRNHLACHNFWHWALFHINENEAEAAVELFETQIHPRASSSEAMLDIVDAASLLYRLDLVEGSKTINKWPLVDKLTRPHEGEAILGFNEAHFMMSCLGNNRIERAHELLDMLKAGKEDNGGWLAATCILLQAMIDYKLERYQATIDKLLPVRYDIVNMGGSDAQRDVFQQLLIAAAAKADTNLWQRLLIERKAAKGQDDFITRQWKTSV